MNQKLTGALKSKTMRFNAGMGAAVVGFETLGPGLASLGVSPILALIINAVLNMGLRWVTTKALEQK